MEAIKKIRSGVQLLPVVENKTRIVKNVFLVSRGLLQVGAAGMDLYAKYDAKSAASVLAQNKQLLVEQVGKLRAAFDEIDAPCEDDFVSFNADMEKLLGFYQGRSGKDAPLPNEFGAFQCHLDQAKRFARENIVDRNVFELESDRVAADIVKAKVLGKATAELEARPNLKNAESIARAQKRDKTLAMAEKLRFDTQSEAAQAKLKKDQELAAKLNLQAEGAEQKQQIQVAQQALHNKGSKSRSRNRNTVAGKTSTHSAATSTTPPESIPE